MTLVAFLQISVPGFTLHLIITCRQKIAGKRVQKMLGQGEGLCVCVCVCVCLPDQAPEQGEVAKRDLKKRFMTLKRDLKNSPMVLKRDLKKRFMTLKRDLKKRFMALKRDLNKRPSK